MWIGAGGEENPQVRECKESIAEACKLSGAPLPEENPERWDGQS
jgi:hypothetical protein